MPHTVHTHSETKRRPAPVTSKASSCGCASHQQTCCQLDCLTQPHFFPGQLLGDVDLNQLLTWSKDKFRLSRFRHGWGVVCGLEVRCDSGSQAVRVGPGYAVDCCGNDILVCEDATKSLDEACNSPVDPCAMPEKSTAGSSAEVGETIDYYGYPIPKREIREKILTIRHTEIPSDFQTALGQRVYDATENCQPSRTRESFTLAWLDPSDQRAATVENWSSEYNACREVVEKYRVWYETRLGEGFGKSPYDREKSIKDWLLKWIDGVSGWDAHPLHQFCWLREGLCRVNEEDLASSNQYITNTLFWLVQDCRNHFLRFACSNCPEDQGVPLARLCLWTPRRGKCQILAIDPYPPHRRPLHLEYWPAPSGLVNVGQAIWQTPEQARALLTEMGLTVDATPITFQIASDPAILYSDLGSPLFVERHQRIGLQVFDAQGCLGQRVVGVQSAPPSNDRTIALEVAIASATAAANEARARADELAQQLRERGEEVVEDVRERGTGAAKASSARRRRGA